MFVKNEGVMVETKFGTLIASHNGSEENPSIMIELRKDTGEVDELIVAVEQRGDQNHFSIFVDVWEEGIVESTETICWATTEEGGQEDAES